MRFSIILTLCSASLLSATKADDQPTKFNLLLALKVIKSKIPDDFLVPKALFESTDQECLMEKFKQHVNDKNILKYLQEFSRKVKISEHKKDLLLAFINVALCCSKNLEKVFAFAFNAAFSFDDDTSIFEEPFKTLTGDLVCYNHYAVNTKLIDPAVYPFLQYQLTNESQERCHKKCKETVNSATQVLKEKFYLPLRTSYSKCLDKKLIALTEKVIFKYAILVPAGLDESQKQRERKNFIQDAREGLNELLGCSAKLERKSQTSGN